MTVKELADSLNLHVIAQGSWAGRPVAGCYLGDLLSRVMSHLEQDQVWITVMGNVNSVAVASLTDCACVLLCEDAPLTEDAQKRAAENNITVLSSSEPAYTLACRIGKLLETDQN
ncbi:DRTGG domain-containing protein [Oscillospiraceae bacterium MB08-C2-2]|nr:DRTGG domain-containing protein [Oscillospiraceae bacterium MB08-C2-2]